jgi:hypothetical protein
LQLLELLSSWACLASCTRIAQREADVKRKDVTSLGIEPSLPD